MSDTCFYTLATQHRCTHFHPAEGRQLSWPKLALQRGVAVTSLGVSTKLLYVGPGYYWDG